MAPVENLAGAREALAAGRPALIWRRLIADTETPVGAALKLIEPGRGDFLLESVEGGEVRGRYSLLGIDPDLVFRATGARCAINRAWRHDCAAFAPLPGDSLAELRALVAACRIEVPAGLPPALACLVGYFGYETIGLVENLPRAPQSELELPDMLFVRPGLILVFDRLSDALRTAGVGAAQIEPVDASRQPLASQGRVPAPLALLFSMAERTSKRLEAPGDRGWFVVRLDDLEPGHVTANDPLVASFQRELGQLTGREYAEQFRRALRKEVGVERNPAALRAVRDRLVGGGN